MEQDEGRAKRRPFVFADPPAFLLYAALLLGSLGYVIVTDGLPNLSQQQPLGLAIWAALCALANLLPIPAARNVSLSMSSPVNVAIALLFPPGLAGAIVLVASISEWEVKRETTPMHAIFNRGQLAMATALTSMVFHIDNSEIPSIQTALLAIVVYHSNLLFVAIAETTTRGTSIAQVFKRLLPPGIGAAASYLGLGGLGVVFALTYHRIGAWAVAVLLIPLLVLRNALRVSRQLEKAEHDRRVLADRLIDERERERTRIASDIHDVVLQELAALQIQADNIVSAIKMGKQEAAENIASMTKDGVGRAITDLRSAIANLRRVSLDDAGLIPTLEKYGRSFHAETGIEVHMSHQDVDAADIPLPVGLLLYECCQEALTNVAKHAKASKVDVAIKRVGETVEMRVKDNGQGMEQVASNGFGMKLTRDKMALAGGMMAVDSKKGMGTEIIVSLPARRES